MSIEKPLSRGQAGLPEKSEVVDVLHNRAAQQTIVEVRLHGTPPIHRLYWRPVGGTRYEALGNPGANESFEGAVSSDRPCIFARALELRPNGTSFTSRVLGVLQAELCDPPSTSLLDLEGVVPEGAWISKILRVDAVGNVEAVLGIRNAQGPVHYAICLLDFANRKLVELDALPGVFF